MFHMVFFQVEVAIWRVRLSILDCSKWKQLDVKKKKPKTKKHEIKPQSKTKQSDECTVTQMTVGATHPSPLPQNICSLKL